MSDDGLSLADIVADLRQILALARKKEETAGPASYDVIQSELAGQLHLHILSYIRFLEGQDFLVYDRIKDQLTVPEPGRQALQAPESWQHEVRQAFAEHIADGGSDEAVDDLLDEVEESFLDDIASGIEEVSASLEANEPADDEPGTIELRPPASEPSGGFTATEQPVDQDLPPASAHGTETMNQKGQSQGVTVSKNPSTADLYNRIDEIGSGGVGTVYRAGQTKLARDVALKEINKVFNIFAGVDRDDIIERFHEVVQAQANLVHPNIVQVIDIETSGEYPFVVTQYAPRGNLRRLIESQDRPDLSVTLNYFLQILNALSVAHDAGVVHGNLKPENVLIDATGNAMLSDFGLSSIVEQEGSSAQVYVGVGTVAYMSPEQFQSPDLATDKSDIYSLGIMFYEMLTGKVPGRRSPMPSNFNADIPEALDDIFDKMSMDAEDDRYDSVQEILDELYANEEVMGLMEHRAAMLFATDPLPADSVPEVATAGAAPASAAGLAESSASEVSEAEEDSEVEEDSDVEEDSQVEEDSEPSEAEDAVDLDEEEEELFAAQADEEDELLEDSIVDEEPPVLDEESVAEEDEDDVADDVLDKLDKYGGMFEEEEA